MSIKLKNAEIDVTINSFEDFEELLNAIDFSCIDFVNDGGVEGAKNDLSIEKARSIALSLWLIEYAARNIEGFIAVRPAIERELEKTLATMTKVLEQSKRLNEHFKDAEVRP